MASQKDNCCAGDGTHYSEHNEPDLGKTDLCTAKRCIAPAIANSQYCLAHQQKAEPQIERAITEMIRAKGGRWNSVQPADFVDLFEKLIHRRAEPAAQQESELQQLLNVLTRVKVRFSRNHGMPNPSEAFPYEAAFTYGDWQWIEQLTQKLRARQAEPAPTPSRAELVEKYSEIISQRVSIPEWAIASFKRNVALWLEEFWAEASSLGAKEECRPRRYMSFGCAKGTPGCDVKHENAERGDSK